MSRIVASQINKNFVKEYFINLPDMPDEKTRAIVAILESCPEYELYVYKCVNSKYELSYYPLSPEIGSKYEEISKKFNMPEEKVPDYKAILFSLCAGIFLCDHMGDVSENVYKALELAGIDISES